jgi:hypothetical protein
VIAVIGVLLTERDFRFERKKEFMRFGIVFQIRSGFATVYLDSAEYFSRLSDCFSLVRQTSAEAE